MKLRTAIDILEDFKEKEENLLAAILLLREKSPDTPRFCSLYDRLQRKHAKARDLRVSWESIMDL